jgi:hypothetical protein
MTTLPWILVIVLGAVVVWLLLALAGASRTITSLRTRDDDPGDPAAAVRHLSTGLPAGVEAPPLGAVDEELRGNRRLVVFVDPDCGACDELVPALQQAVHDLRFPFTVLVDRGDGANDPSAWRTRIDRVRWVHEDGGSLSDAYDVDVTPTAFLVDEGGVIVAGGPAATMDDVLALVDETRGVRITPGTSRVDTREVHRGTA